MFVSKSISNIKVVVQSGTVQVSQNIKHYITQVTKEGKGAEGGEEAERERERKKATKEKRRRVTEKQPFMGD